MAESDDNPLPEGVTLIRRSGDEPVEVAIRARDVDDLAWVLHDLIPLIQSGELAELFEKLQADQKLPK